MSDTWPDLSPSLPDGFQIRSGINPVRMRIFGDQVGARELPGVNILVVAAIIAGEPPSEQPQSVCMLTIGPCARLLSDLHDDIRPRLLPYAWAMVGTHSRRHAPARLRALGLMAVEAARLQAAAFTRAAPGDYRVEHAIAAACAYWNEPDAATAEIANAAQKVASAASYEVFERNRPAGLAAAAAACAAQSAHSAYIAFETEAAFFSAAVGRLIELPTVLEGVRARFAVAAAESAAMAALTPDDVEGAFWRDDVADCVQRGLRNAIEAGPHGTVAPHVAASRLAASATALAGAVKNP